MSIRIKRAIGWGLDHETFLAHQTLGVGTRPADLDAALEERFTTAGDAGLTLSREERRAFNATGQRPALDEDDEHPPVVHVSVIEPRLLALKLSVYEKGPIPLGEATALYDAVTEGDRPVGMIFYPDLQTRQRWHHFDDDVDYAFARAQDADPESFMRPVPLGHHPWTNDRMMPTGEPVAWQAHDPAAVPAIPATIRWYLAKLKILDEAGILALRPVIAQWWS